MKFYERNIPDEVMKKLKFILENMPTDLTTKLEKVRYLYLAYCSMCAYDDVYRYLLLASKNEESEKVYRESDTGYARVENDSIVGICNSFAYHLGYLCQEAGINSEISKDISEFDILQLKSRVDDRRPLSKKVNSLQSHTRLIVYGDNNELILADPHYAYEVQAGLRTEKGFGVGGEFALGDKDGDFTDERKLYPIKTQAVSPTKLLEIDRKICERCPWINYLRDGKYVESLINIYIERLRDLDRELIEKGEEPLDVIGKIETFFEEAPEYFGFKFADSMERGKAYKRILERMFSEITGMPNSQYGFLTVDTMYLRDLKLEGRKIETSVNLNGKDWLPVIVIKAKRAPDGRHTDEAMVQREKDFYGKKLGRQLEDLEVCALYACYPGEDTYRFLAEVSGTTLADRGSTDREDDDWVL